jgi:hypothetical protein
MQRAKAVSDETFIKYGINPNIGRFCGGTPECEGKLSCLLVHGRNVAL